MRERKFTDEELLESYKRTKSVWKTGEELGVCGQSVHERLVKLGANNHVNVFTDEDKKVLEECYIVYRDAGKLQDLADSMGRTKQFICRQAGKLGITDKNCKRPYIAVWKYAPESVLRPILEQYAKSRLTMSEYCKSHNYGELGFERAMQRNFPAEWETVVELKKSNAPMYKRGRDFEYAVKHNLEKNGFVCMRSPASKSPADLMAVRHGKTIFVQCKLHGALPPAEWNAFIDYAEKAGVSPIMAARKKTGTGIDYFLLTGKKDGSKRRQPMKAIDFTGRTDG